MQGKVRFLIQKARRGHHPGVRAGVVLATSLAFLWLLVWGMRSEWVFVVENVSCEREDEPCGEQILAELDALKGTSLLTLDRSQLVEKWRNADPSIASVSLEKQLPFTLSVKITSREPEVGVLPANDPFAYVLDAQGVAFAKSEPNLIKLPSVVTSAITINLGEAIQDERTLKAVELAKALRESHIPFQKIEVSGLDLAVTLNGGTLALFSQSKAFFKQATTLQRILAQDTIDQKIEKVDLRHEKPVLTLD